MSKTDIIVTAVSASIAFVAILALTAFSQIQKPEPSQSASVTGSPAAGLSGLPDHLSMGPDPGGKTGDTVTPATTKTGQPSADGAAGASREAGGSSAAAPGAATDGTDSRTGPGSSARKSK